MQIVRNTSPSEQEIEFISEKLKSETPDYGPAYPYAFFMKDDHGEILGACSGEAMFGGIHTNQLWVHPDYRGKGYGRKLMENVHEYGREIGCNIATVVTMSFQGAHEFYEKLGYHCDFEQLGYANGAKCLFLRKIL